MPVTDDPWTYVWPHRERLLRIARRRCSTREEAEDVVQEAMLRCATYKALDPEQVEALLTTVTIRLCSNLRRDKSVATRLAHRIADPLVTEPSEVAVCDRAHARWFAERAEQVLSQTELATARRRADGGAIADVAESLGMTPKAVEMTLRRARTKLRPLRLVAIVPFFRVLRRSAAPAAATTVAIALAATISVQAGPSRAPAAPPVTAPRVTVMEPHDHPMVRVAATARATRPVRRAPVVLPTARRAAARAASIPARPVEAPSHVVVPGVTAPAGDAHVGDSTVTVEDDETPDERAQRCLTEGVEVSIGPAGVAVVCRESTEG